jgi:adenylosuccinate lyase
MPSYDHNTALSPFTWRYGSEDMRQLWSEVYKRRLWRRIWVALAKALHTAGLVTEEQVEDLSAHAQDIDIERSLQIEAEIHHDLMAEVKCFAEQCKIGGGIIHLGMTSADVEDNADAYRIAASLSQILTRLVELLYSLFAKINAYANLPCMAYTHLQPAEVTTVGYRLAVYAQDLYDCYESLLNIRSSIRGKGLKGAVGTSASYVDLLRDTGMTPAELEGYVLAALELEAYPVATQTYSRRQDYIVLTGLADLALILHKMALDMRLLQAFGEWSEPFGKSQVGSSAMPFKRNPINAENIDSLARYLAALPGVAWENAAQSALERTLDDSANRRVVLPDAFLAADEMLRRMTRLVENLVIDEQAIRRTVAKFGVFAATERVLIAATRAGGDRQQLHEIIRQHSLTAWEALRQEQPNPLVDLLATDAQITTLLSAEQVRDLMRADDYVGEAPERAKKLTYFIPIWISHGKRSSG